MKKIDYDVVNEEFLSNIDEWVKLMQEEDQKVYWHPTWRHWMIQDPDYIKEALLNTEVFSMQYSPIPFDPTPGRGRWRRNYSTVVRDGEHHTKARRHVVRYYQENGKDFFTYFKSSLENILNNIQDGQVIDAYDIMGRVIADVQIDMYKIPYDKIGYNEEIDKPRLKQGFYEFMKPGREFSTFVREHDYSVSLEESSEFFKELRDIIVASAKYFLKHRDEGTWFNMIYDIVDEQDSYKDDPIKNCLGWFIALQLGVIPNFVASVFSNFIVDIAKQKKFAIEIKEDRSLIPLFIDESLRLAPVYGGIRETTTFHDFHGHKMWDENMVFFNTYAANRNPKYFKDPFTFNMYRPEGESKHFSFSYGSHKCVGEHVVKLFLQETANQIFDKFSNVEIAQEARYLPSMIGSVPILDGLKFRFQR